MTTKTLFEIVASVRGQKTTFTVHSDTQDHAVNSVQRQLTPLGGVVVSIRAVDPNVADALADARYHDQANG
jgi:hypothetical protein